MERTRQVLHVTESVEHDVVRVESAVYSKGSVPGIVNAPACKDPMSCQNPPISGSCRNSVYYCVSWRWEWRVWWCISRSYLSAGRIMRKLCVIIWLFDLLWQSVRGQHEGIVTVDHRSWAEKTRNERSKFEGKVTRILVYFLGCWFGRRIVVLCKILPLLQPACIVFVSSSDRHDQGVTKDGCLTFQSTLDRQGRYF